MAAVSTTTRLLATTEQFIIQIKVEGKLESLDYRVIFVDHSGKKVSPWHDVPLHLGNGVFNFVVRFRKRRVPKWRLLQMRFLILLSKILRKETFVTILDVVEIGERLGEIGQILIVKPLAALAMIDGDLDWKIVAISLDDPRASLVNDVDDVEKHFPEKANNSAIIYF